MRDYKPILLHRPSYIKWFWRNFSSIIGLFSVLFTGSLLVIHNYQQGWVTLLLIVFCIYTSVTIHGWMNQ